MRDRLAAAWHDLRYVTRNLLRERHFTALAILTLALGIGATTAIFTVINRVVLRPLPYPEPDRIVYLGWHWSSGARADFLSARTFTFWHDQSRDFDALAAYQTFTRGLGADGVDADVHGLAVTEDFFRVLRTRPSVGRPFSPEEFAPGATRVAMLSNGLWQRRFGEDRQVLNHDIQINGQSYTVIGVLSPQFTIAGARQQPDVVLPLAITTADLANNSFEYWVIGRLRPGLSLAQANANGQATFAQYRTAYPQFVQPEDRGVQFEDFGQLFVGDLRKPLWILLGATGFVLLLTCANVANLLLARAIGRQREIAVRTALGATRSRIVSLQITEGVVIGALAAVLGILISVGVLRALLGLAPRLLPVSETPSPDGVVLAFGCLLAIASGVALGLIDALPAFRLDVARLLTEGGRTGTRGKRHGQLRNALIAIESSLAIPLLAGAALLITTFVRLLTVDPGYLREGLVTATMPRTPAGYDSVAKVSQFEQRVLASVRAAPNVIAAAGASALPLQGGVNMPMTVDGQPDATEGAIQWRAISPDYFRTLGITLMRGRDFNEGDAGGAPGVVIISQSTAEHYWPHQDPIGERITIGQLRGRSIAPAFDEPPRVIVGVAADTRQLGMAYDAPRFVFVPQGQVPPGLVFLPSFVVRSAGAVNVAPLRRAIADADPRMPLPQVATMRELVAASLGEQRFNAVLMGLFAALALAVTSIGIYGVVSYSVTNRAREIGLRMALGASAAAVVRLVVRQGMLPVVIGLGAGLAASLALTRLLSGMIYGVAPRDPAMLAIVTAVLITVALIGTWLPAWRATRIDPLLALRAD